ncbi:LuxR C-terminal-related transcriptional regulator [Streptomyces sp. NPDC091281]|uniref:LuxR C-terminal-related transcriptional regulator n=1 Tax=Streptomyces sp. NPDC091281 TaxID=3365985 RepID=UPI003825ECD1
MTTVLVLHSVSLMRSALEALLRTETSFDVRATGWRSVREHAEYTGHAGHAEYAGYPWYPAHTGGSGPDVCLVDLDCPDARLLLEDGAGAGRAPGEAVVPGAGLVVLASARRPGALRRAFEARALGFVDKYGSAQRLIKGITEVAAGGRFVDDSLAYGFLEASRMPLTARELSVLSRAAEGESVAEIARGLHLSNGTVRNYMASATRKVGARNRIDAIRITRGAGWV